MTKTISLLDYRGIRYDVDLAQFSYSMRVQGTNNWTLVFANKERIVVSKVRADMIENLAHGYRHRVMSEVIAPTKRRKRR